MAPGVLAQALAALPRTANSNVLLGFETSDDAGVYKLSEECALVQTVDFFTPIVDDPYTFGAIAAANSLSDVYAMGGVAISALSILCYPGEGDMEVLREILRGGAEKMIEAGCALLGGHSVADEEIKFGYAVTGTVHPERYRANAHAKAGDVLVLTKPLGTGVISTALKRGQAEEAWVAAATESMLRLNREAAVAMQAVEAHGCTDITGFGMLGHGREMALASGVTLKIEAKLIPALPGAREAIAAGAIPGGLKRNRSFVAEDLRVEAEVEEADLALLCDPQTSGGLLVSLPEGEAAEFLQRTTGWRIGRVTAKGEKAIWIR